MGWSTARRRATLAAQRRAPGGAREDHRERPDPGGSRRRALAADRSGQWLWEEFGISVSKQTLEPGAAGARLSQAVGAAAPSCPGRGAVAAFKKTSPPAWTRSAALPPRHRIEIWFAGRGAHRPEEQDHPALGEARHAALGAARSAHALGLHLRRHLPERGQGRRPRPAPLQHRRHDRAPRRDRAAVAPELMPSCSSTRPAGTCRRRSPSPTTSPSCRCRPIPELNPVENVWQFMRDNWLSNRVFASYDDIVDHCCDAWNKLVDQPWTIMSIGLRIGHTGADQRYRYNSWTMACPVRAPSARRRLQAGGASSFGQILVLRLSFVKFPHQSGYCFT